MDEEEIFERQQLQKRRFFIITTLVILFVSGILLAYYLGIRKTSTDENDFIPNKGEEEDELVPKDTADPNINNKKDPKSGLDKNNSLVIGTIYFSNSGKAKKANSFSGGVVKRGDKN
ncbi:hypothetical protein NUSPORA_01897 [Nucleospora cyclopteri]